jgi:hypothetical protein
LLLFSGCSANIEIPSDLTIKTPDLPKTYIKPDPLKHNEIRGIKGFFFEEKEWRVSRP